MLYICITMRDLIIQLMNKIIIPKYPYINYHVVASNDLGWNRSIGYEVSIRMKDFENNKEDQKELVKDVEMILFALGLKKGYIGYLLRVCGKGYEYQTDRRYIKIIGIE